MYCTMYYILSVCKEICVHYIEFTVEAGKNTVTQAGAQHYLNECFTFSTQSKQAKLTLFIM